VIPVLAVVWCGGLAGATLQLLRGHNVRWLAVGPYLALGWTAMVVVPQLFDRLGGASFGLLVLGAALYTLGATVWPALPPLDRSRTPARAPGAPPRGHHLHAPATPVGNPQELACAEAHKYDVVLLGQVGRHAADHAVIPRSLRIEAPQKEGGCSRSSGERSQPRPDPTSCSASCTSCVGSTSGSASARPGPRPAHRPARLTSVRS
jgi:hypothetical protein